MRIEKRSSLIWFVVGFISASIFFILLSLIDLKPIQQKAKPHLTAEQEIPAARTTSNHDRQRIREQARKEIDLEIAALKRDVPQISSSDSVPTPKPIDTLEPSPLPEEIIVKEDVLIASMLIKKVSEIDQSDSLSADSIEQKLADIQNIKEAVYRLDYWESPLNSKGYKFANKSILLFGLTVDSFAQVVEFNDALYLRNINVYYKLNESFEFAPLKQVADSGAILHLDAIRNAAISKIPGNGK